MISAFNPPHMVECLNPRNKNHEYSYSTLNGLNQEMNIHTQSWIASTIHSQPWPQPTYDESALMTIHTQPHTKINSVRLDL